MREQKEGNEEEEKNRYIKREYACPLRNPETSLRCIYEKNKQKQNAQFPSQLVLAVAPEM